MQPRIKKRIAAAATAVATAGALVVGMTGSSAAAAAAPSLRAFGILNNGTVMCTFLTNQPQQLDWVRQVSGLDGDVRLVGIDFRVQDRKFYGVGNYGGVYTISLPTGSSDPVVVKKVSQLSIALNGTTFGVDFNPAADRLRVISDAGQNLRHNLTDGVTIKDKDLNTPPTAGATTGVTAAAYTNNDLNADTGTTLFDINTSSDQVVIQSPPNEGSLVPTGRLGPDAALDAGFDIYSDLLNGKTVSATGFATLLSSSGTGTLYTVDVLTGAATRVGDFPLPVTDIAVSLDTN